MHHISAVIIGAGQAGLAISRCLFSRQIDHVVLERGRVAERWRSERWESLRLLTPNWMNQFPDWSYQGEDADGFMTAAEYAASLEQYATSFMAPVITGATVLSVCRIPGGYRVESSQGTWHARSVVIATGHCDVPYVPEMARCLAASISQLTPTTYRRPDDLPDGGVLVVGAAASGVQLAEEIQRSGRQVTLSVSRHTRLPRRYRGRDIMWWLHRHGMLEREAITTDDLEDARSLPSIQLIGRPEPVNLDLAVLRNIGVRLIGRVAGVQAGVLRLNRNLVEAVAGSHTRLHRLLARIDVFADAVGAPAERHPEPFAVDESPTNLDPAANGIRTVIWATGFRRNYSWLHVPVLDASGDIIHTRGVTPAAGLYVTGFRFLRQRDASFIAAVNDDATELAESIQRHLDAASRIAA
jgi:putative flavoprotein involved in K+ transport